MSFVRLFTDLFLDQTHIALIRKVSLNSDKSTQILLGMMIRKNKQVQQSISDYFLQYKLNISHQKCFNKPKKVILKTPKLQVIKANIENKQLILKENSCLPKQSFNVERKLIHQNPSKLLSKLAIIQFPTFNSQLKQSAPRYNSGNFLRRHLSYSSNDQSNFNNTRLLFSSVLSSQQQLLLIKDMESFQKQNKPSIRIKTLKTLKLHESAQIGTSRQTYLKPVPIQGFYTKFQSETNSRMQLIHPRFNVRKNRY